VPDGYIPIKYSCFATEVSPHLKWSITSDAVKSFVLIMEDIDAIPIVQHPYVHWDVYNIPGTVREIVEGATLHAMPFGSIEGINDDEHVQYSGPCPPDLNTHHYYFALYAINTETLAVDAGHVIRRSDFETRYANNIIQKVEIIGLFKK
jgi:Raf kinase inhibitor-like YbhB/YbcL family protein